MNALLPDVFQNHLYINVPQVWLYHREGVTTVLFKAGAAMRDLNVGKWIQISPHCQINLMNVCPFHTCTSNTLSATSLPYGTRTHTQYTKAGQLIGMMISTAILASHDHENKTIEIKL